MWHGIHGHDAVVEQFRAALARNRLASTFLFVGEPGIGKRTFAVKFAQALLCETNAEAELNPCGRCAACQQVAAGTHPDLEIVCKPADKSEIPVALFLGDEKHHLTEGLCHKISLKPFRGGRKIAIIDDADYMNDEGANGLLKTLEEPPPRSVLILIGTAEQSQLPTVRSRCQTIRFQPLAPATVAQLLLEQQVVESAAEANALAKLAGGSLEMARQLAADDVREFRRQFLETLADPEFDGVACAKTVNEYVKEAAEGAPRRERMRQLAKFAAGFYGGLTNSLAGHASVVDAVAAAAIHRALRRWNGNIDSALACLERCLETANQVDANANQATLMDCWIDDLSLLGRGQRV